MLIVVTLPAQRRLSVSVGFDVPGLGYGYKFQQNGDVLKRGGKGYYRTDLAFSAKLRYRFSKYVGMEASYNRVEYDMGVHDKAYIKNNNRLPDPRKKDGSAFDGQPGYLGAYKYYNSPGFALYTFIPFPAPQSIKARGIEDEEEPNASFYMAIGMLYNTRSGKEEYRNSYYDPTRDEELLLVTHYMKNFRTVYCETGITIASPRGAIYNFGLKYVFGKQIMQADYTDGVDGVLIRHDQVTAKANYFALTMNIGYAFSTKKKQNSHQNGD